MSSSTRTQIDNMQALTAPNSISPSSLGVILEAIETELDGNDSSYTNTTIHDRTKTLETSSSSLSTRMTAAEGNVSTLQTTVATQGNSIATLQSTSSSQGNSITALQNSYASHNSRIGTLETKTNVGSTQYGGTNSIASSPQAIPYYEDIITTDGDYPTEYVKITSGSTAQVDFTNIDLPEHRFIIDCQDDIDLGQELDSYNINHIQSMQLQSDKLYELTIMRILSTKDHTVYSGADVEFHAFLKQLN